ncbi:MAG: FprA family A-type flavoprotein [Dissulfurimicrobium sp.]|uniref:FprA family A-type flavoprotein n=1 Tax=Dissulfurimicrobium sp. TaxID=2022436 RepID=UPI00404A8B9E
MASIIEIKKDIYWVGAVDWTIRDFHGYSTYKGTTYNSYLMKDEKTVLFDTVKKEKRSDLAHHIRAIMDPEKIDYIVVNHVEMDHSGSLPEMIDMIKPEKVFCSAMGKKAILEHFHREDWPLEVVTPNQPVSTGKRSIQFIETRMLHWPDSMFSYIPEEKLLISSDAFGEHWATSERFDDEVDFAELMHHNAKYYANILLLYSPLVQKLLENLKKSGLAIDMIAPDHGLIKRSHIADILKAYDDWSSYKTKKKALVIYDTMWHSTEMMAKAVADGIMDEGVSVQLMDLQVTHRSDIITQVLDARAVVLGSPTLNNGMLPRMAGFLQYMKGLKPGNKIGAAFGSYGWSGEAVKHINQVMEEMKFTVTEPGIRVKYVPTHHDLKECVEMGRRIGKAVKTD